MQNPYLPDIMKAVVSRVDGVLNKSTNVDPFQVFFKYGTYEEVTKRIKECEDEEFPMVYLVMPYQERRGNDPSIFADITTRMLIVMKTEAEFKQIERDTEVFKPRLIPVYEELLRQICLDKMFATVSENSIRHDRMLRPYSGMGAVNAPGAENLFELFVDWIDITNLHLRLRFC